MHRVLSCIVVLAGLAACSQPPPPRSVDDLMADRILLDAVLIRCAENRVAARQDSECHNARLAVERLDARERAQREAEQRAAFERRREEIRRSSEQAAELRHRQEEAARAEALIGAREPSYLEPVPGSEEGESVPAFGAPLGEPSAGAVPPRSAPQPAPAGRPLTELTEEQLQAEIARLQEELARRQARRPPQ